jgi:hypothetical protein
MDKAPERSSVPRRFYRPCILGTLLGFVLCAIVAAPQALAFIVYGKECDRGICVEAHCFSNPVDVWVTLTEDVYDVTIRKDEVTHYNLQSWCFKETQRELNAVGRISMPPDCNFSLQVCKRGGHNLLLRMRSQCSDWGSFKGMSCPEWTKTFGGIHAQQPAPAPPPEPAGACGPGKYGTEGCPYPSFGGSKEQSDFVVFCQDYASRAVAAVAESTQLGCGKSGDRWIPDYLPHANWCISLNGDRTLPNAETAARSQELYECRSQVMLPGRSGGVSALKHLKPLQDTTTPTPMPIPQDAGDTLVLKKRGGKDALAALLPGAAAPATPEPVAPAPPRVCPKTFTGAWSTLTQTGGEFRLDLQQKGKRVAGTFTHENPVYNGALQGRRNGSQLAFTTAQPNYGPATGEFVLSASGCEISGRFWMNDNPGQVYSWTGTRLQ